jgi:signal peptidase I
MQGQLSFENKIWAIKNDKKFFNDAFILHPKYTTEYLDRIFLKDGDIIDYNTGSIYIEPVGIHCNRGEDVTVAHIRMNPYFVSTKEGLPSKYGFKGIVVAPTEDAVKQYIRKINPTASLYVIDINLIPELSVNTNIDTVCKLV